MIQLIIPLAIAFPIVLGILSVDINGNEFSIIEYLISARNDSNIDVAFIANMTGVQDPNYVDKPTMDGAVEPPESLIVFPEEINVIFRMISNGIVFVALFGRELGVYIGMSTAPFHYFVALGVAMAFFYPAFWLYITGWVYLLVRERKEIIHIIKSGLKEAEIKRSLLICVHEVKDEIQRKLRKK